MIPHCLITASCWSRVCAELDRVFPDEAVLVPLCGLLYRDPERSPCAPVRLDDLQQVVIARAVLLPGEAQRNSLTRVQVLPGGDAIINAAVLEAARRHPRLRACGVLHSHPFAACGTHPSSGSCGDVEGHMRPLLSRNRETGLLTCFSFIACRGRSGGWLLQAFALDQRQELRDLGFVQAISDEAPLIRPLLLAPLERRSPQRFLLRRWRRELRGAGWRTRSDELFDGWVRIVVELSPELRAVILLPLEFPAASPRYFALLAGERIVPFQPRGTPRLGPGAWRLALLQMREAVHAG